MPLLNKLKYEKVRPWRDAKLFIIVCEGERREFQYFNYFDGLSRRLKVVAVPNIEGKGSPKYLQINAENTAQEYDDGGIYELWIVIDVDRWEKGQLHDIQLFCKEKKNWSVAISNPCFEVWLYFHFEKKLPVIGRLNQCKTWKQLVHQQEQGGFDSAYHPALLGKAIQYAKLNYSNEGYFPKIGSTQIHFLGEKLYDLVKEILEK